MGEKLSHKQHRWILTIVILGSLIIGIMFGKKLNSMYLSTDILSILTYGMIFLNSILLIIILSILVRMEEDFYYHHKKFK